MKRQNEIDTAREYQPMNVTERVRVNTGDVHPGWIRATSILLRGLERLRLQDAAEAEDAPMNSRQKSPAPD